MKLALSQNTFTHRLHLCASVVFMLCVPLAMCMAADSVLPGADEITGAAEEGISIVKVLVNVLAAAGELGVLYKGYKMNKQDEGSGMTTILFGSAVIGLGVIIFNSVVNSSVAT